ncbi:MAG: hypothetical protein AB7Q97_16300 [Gammaproteobacteria bacterium]
MVKAKAMSPSLNERTLVERYSETIAEYGLPEPARKVWAAYLAGVAAGRWRHLRVAGREVARAAPGQDASQRVDGR